MENDARTTKKRTHEASMFSEPIGNAHAEACIPLNDVVALLATISGDGGRFAWTLQVMDTHTGNVYNVRTVAT